VYGFNSEAEMLLAFLLEGLGGEGHVLKPLSRATRRNWEQLFRHRGEIITAGRAAIIAKCQEIIKSK
jgi:hypothetical protein